VTVDLQHALKVLPNVVTENILEHFYDVILLLFLSIILITSIKK